MIFQRREHGNVKQAFRAIAIFAWSLGFVSVILFPDFAWAKPNFSIKCDYCDEPNTTAYVDLTQTAGASDMIYLTTTVIDSNGVQQTYPDPVGHLLTSGVGGDSPLINVGCRYNINGLALGRTVYVAGSGNYFGHSCGGMAIQLCPRCVCYCDGRHRRPRCQICWVPCQINIDCRAQPDITIDNEGHTKPGGNQFKIQARLTNNSHNITHEVHLVALAFYRNAQGQQLTPVGHVAAAAVLLKPGDTKNVETSTIDFHGTSADPNGAPNANETLVQLFAFTKDPSSPAEKRHHLEGHDGGNDP
jgi:hypothetical protein